MKRKILIVEDDRDISDSLAMALEQEGYEVELATNGLVALERLSSERLPDLMLLDITMPTMNAVEFLPHQKENPQWSQIPVVLMSAANDSVRQGILKQVTDHIKKPMDLSDLFQTIEKNLPKKTHKELA